MKVALEVIGKPMPSKKTKGTCTTLIFKDIDTKKEYKLYLDDTFDSSKKWYQHLKIGNIFDNVNTLQNPKFKNIIDGNSDFKVTRKIAKSIRFVLDVREDEKLSNTHTTDSVIGMINYLESIKDDYK